MCPVVYYNMRMEWNERQSDAISSSGETLLVAAAAGSGKTAVLVERIIRLLCEEGRSLSEMLIVTFTQAAASEMKEKIYKALTDAAADETIEVELSLGELGTCKQIWTPNAPWPAYSQNGDRESVLVETHLQD